jgi:hypothetical protein
VRGLFNISSMGNNMSEKEFREVCNKVAAEVLEKDPDVCDSLENLSDYYFAHPSELRCAINEYEVLVQK